jgi:hypothetical protein
VGEVLNGGVLVPKIKKTLTVALAAATLVGGLAVAGESSAQSRHHYRHRDHTGAAVAAGVAGLALGAALAGRGGYSSGYYSPNYGYYGPSYGPSYGYSYGYARPYYDRRYYAPRPYARSCVYWRYDRWGRAYQVRGRC